MQIFTASLKSDQHLSYFLPSKGKRAVDPGQLPPRRGGQQVPKCPASSWGPQNHPCFPVVPWLWSLLASFPVALCRLIPLAWDHHLFLSCFKNVYSAVPAGLDLQGECKQRPSLMSFFFLSVCQQHLKQCVGRKAESTHCSVHSGTHIAKD